MKKEVPLSPLTPLHTGPKLPSQRVTPGSHNPDTTVQLMIPTETEKEEMAKPSKEGKNIDPKKLPTYPMELLQMQVAEQMSLVHKVVATLRSMPTGRPGGGGGGDSDPDSSDSHDSNGEPKL